MASKDHSLQLYALLLFFPFSWLNIEFWTNQGIHKCHRLSLRYLCKCCSLWAAVVRISCLANFCSRLRLHSYIITPRKLCLNPAVGYMVSHLVLLWQHSSHGFIAAYIFSIPALCWKEPEGRDSGCVWMCLFSSYIVFLVPSTLIET